MITDRCGVDEDEGIFAVCQNPREGQGVMAKWTLVDLRNSAELRKWMRQ